MKADPSFVLPPPQGKPLRPKLLLPRNVDSQTPNTLGPTGWGRCAAAHSLLGFTLLKAPRATRPLLTTRRRAEAGGAGPGPGGGRGAPAGGTDSPLHPAEQSGGTHRRRKQESSPGSGHGPRAVHSHPVPLPSGPAHPWPPQHSSSLNLLCHCHPASPGHPGPPPPLPESPLFPVSWDSPRPLTSSQIGRAHV